MKNFSVMFVLRKKHSIFATSILGAVFGCDRGHGRHVSMSGQVTTPVNRVTKL